MTATSETKLVEVHGNDGNSVLTVARNLVAKTVKGAVVTDARYCGLRCDHGNSVIAVTYHVGG